LAGVAGTFVQCFCYLPLVTLLLPVFMSDELGYNYVSIGILFMVYNISSSAVTWLALKLPLNFERAFIPSAIYIFATFSLVFSGMFFPALLFALAFGRGFTIAFFEHGVSKVSIRSKNVSADIGLLHVPIRVAQFLSVLLSGIFTQLLGYGPVFAVIGASFVAFAFLSLRILTFDENH
jgi:hypothetical protein